MVVPQLDYEVTRLDLSVCTSRPFLLRQNISFRRAKSFPLKLNGQWCAVGISIACCHYAGTAGGSADDERAFDDANVAICRNLQPQKVLLPGGTIIRN